VKLPIRLPTELLSAHDEGRLVFFCGAGISRYTGLGDFKGLRAKGREPSAAGGTAVTQVGVTVKSAGRHSAGRGAMSV
jgi:hypothetical protein